MIQFEEYLLEEKIRVLRVNLGFSEPIGLGVPRIHYLRFAGTHCVTVKVDGLRECKDANYVVSSRVNKSDT